MQIRSYNTITLPVLNDIKAIESACKEFDKLKQDISLEISLNFYKDMNSIFIGYLDSMPVSLLVIFMPTPKEAEITAHTLPTHRRQGFFKALLSEAIKELRKYDVSDILFLYEGQSPSGHEAIVGQNGKYEFTEHFMVYNPGSFSPSPTPRRTKLRKCGLESLDRLVHLSQEIFHDTYESAMSLTSKVLSDDSCEQYGILLDDELIGIGYVRTEEGECMLCALGIAPELQDQGLGKELLNSLLSILMERKSTITLEVDSSNTRAFELYKKSGFQVYTSYSYYRKKL